nr:NAD(P)H-binding protein [Maliibacterium massiliense]
MNMAVVCANGKAGRCIVDEALARGVDVTAIARGTNKSNAKKALSKDLFDLTQRDLAAFDVVVDAFGAWTPETLPQHSASLAHLCDILSGSAARLLVVGGAGSLYVDDAHSVTLSDTPDFPDAFKPLAAAMAAALAALRARKDVRWTYISPAADFQADGPRTGAYLVGGEQLVCSTAGQSVISYADYAIALVDEALRAGHVGQRISVVQR